ncbi:hypothetical protein DAI22_02g073300 [Oryza sativa Japonica Group]|nr:hypothetical protein DAI22_02g073300 [Oryza sativa Japonica Group]
MACFCIQIFFYGERPISGSATRALARCRGVALLPGPAHPNQNSVPMFVITRKFQCL